MTPLEQVEDLNHTQTDHLIGALAWRIDNYGIITRHQWDKAVRDAKERS